MNFELQTKLVKKLLSLNLKIATVESCTGGLLSKMITDVPGSSEIFDCGICSYANEIKEKIIGVKHETLEKFGAVSSQTAEEMAVGIKNLAKSDIAVSTTGIAGPGGGTSEKPVGTVYFCIIIKDRIFTDKLRLNGTRDEIRLKTAEAVFNKLLELCDGKQQ